MTRRFPPGAQRAAGLVIAIAIFAIALPRFASYREVWPVLADFEQAAAAPLMIFAGLNLIAPSIAHLVALPGLTLRRAAVSDWTTTAVTNVLPGGSAIAVGLTAAMYHSWGHRRSDIARAIVATGVWDLFVKLAMPGLALVWLATQQSVDRGLFTAAIIGGAMLLAVVILAAAAIASPRVGRFVAALLERAPRTGTDWGDRVDRVRVDVVDLVRRRGGALTAATIAGHLNLALLLVVCLRGVGVESAELSTAAIVAAFAFGRLITAIPITPGGIGVMELGLTAALAASGTAEEAQILAAVLLFRFLSFAVPIPLGLAGWVWWNRSRLAPA